MKHDMERELLEWKKGMLELRRKYRDTPPGFQDDRTEQAYLDKFSEEQEAYRKKREHYLKPSGSQRRNHLPEGSPI